MYVQEHIFESDGHINCNTYLLMGKYVVVCKSNSYLQGLHIGKGKANFLTLTHKHMIFCHLEMTCYTYVTYIDSVQSSIVTNTYRCYSIYSDPVMLCIFVQLVLEVVLVLRINYSKESVKVIIIPIVCNSVYMHTPAHVCKSSCMQ